MTSFENIHEIDLFSLIKITSVAPFDEFNDTCAKDNLAIVIDKDYIKNRLKVRLLQLKKEIWLDAFTQFEMVIVLWWYRKERKYLSQDKLLIAKGLLIGSALISYKIALLIGYYKQHKNDVNNMKSEESKEGDGK